MVRYKFLLALILCLFFLNVSASNVNFTYLDPSFQNDFGLIELSQFASISQDYNPGLAVFVNELDDVSISYIYDFTITDTSIKKDIEHIQKLNDDYIELQNKKSELVDKGYELISFLVITSPINFAVLLTSLPVIISVALVESVPFSPLLFDFTDTTLEYYSDYIELVRSSSNHYNSLLYKVEQNDRELIKMGISNPNYNGISVNDYSQTQFYINSVNTKGLIQREVDIKNELSYPLDGLYYTGLLWNLNAQFYDLIDSKNSIYYNLISTFVLQEKIKKNLQDENNLLNSESENLRVEIFNKLKEVDENYYEIDEYYIMKFSLTSSDFSITPREHINLAYIYYEEAFYEMSSAKKILSSKSDNYLIDSTIHFDNAIALLVKCDMELSYAMIKGDKIYSEAEKKVLLKYDNAIYEYDSFSTYTEMDIQNKEIASKYLTESLKLIESEGSISEKLFSLHLADSKIDSALSYLNPSNVFYDNVKEETKKALEYLDKIIILAKKDKVDVSYEEEFLLLSNYAIKDKSISISEMFAISEEVILLSNNIYDRSKNQYVHLDSKFESIKNFILILNSYNPSLTFTEYNYIINYYSAEGFDKYTSLGNYLELSSKLQILENKINLNKKNIIESMLVFNSLVSSNYYSDICLDVPSKLTITYSTFFNVDSLDYDGPVKFEIPFYYDPYSADEISKGEDITFSFTNKKLSLLINNFNSSKVYSFTLNYNKLFAKTLNVKYSSIPISSSSVQIIVEREIENVAVSSLTFNKTAISSDGVDLFLNGDFYGRFDTKSILINKPLDAGKNKLKEIYLFENPLIYSITELSSVGNVRKIKVVVKNILPFDMKAQPLVVNTPILTPLTYNFIESTCTVDKKGYTLNSNSQNSKIYFVSDYSSNGECSFILEFTGEYDKDEINDEIDSLLNNTNNSKVKDYLNKAKNEVDSDKINNALINIDKAKELINQDIISEKELSSLKIEYNSTYNELLFLISDLRKIENKKVSDIVVKAEKYMNEAEALTDYNKKILKLITVKSELDKLKGIGIDTKLNLLNRLNIVMEQWMDFVNVGFKDSIDAEMHSNLVLLNSIDFSKLSSEDFVLLFNIENEILKYENEIKELNKDKKSWENGLGVLYKQLNNQLSNLIKSVELSCGNDCPSDLIQLAKSNLNLNPTDSYSYSLVNGKITESISQLQNYLNDEKSLALRAFEDAKDFVSNITDEESRKVYLRKLNDIQSLINTGSYLVAKKEALYLLNSIYDETSEITDNNILLIGAGIGAILLAFILIKIKSLNNTEKVEEFKNLKKSNEYDNKSEKESM